VTKNGPIIAASKITGYQPLLRLLSMEWFSRQRRDVC
jgi:hypothetical protein